MKSLDLSVLVVSWNTRDLLRNCLRSALDSFGALSGEVIVVDNASADGSAEMVRREFAVDPRIRLVVNSRNEGFARGNNQACAEARADTLMLANPDIVVTPAALTGMVDYLKSHPRAGIVSCNLVDKEGGSQSLHRTFPTLPIVFCHYTRAGRRLDRWLLGGWVGRRYHLKSIKRAGAAVIDQAAAACLVISRSTIARIGGLFDETFPIFFNDVDLARRIRDAGLEVHVLYDLSVFHHGGASIKQMPPGRKSLEQVDGLVRYYDLHEPGWKGSLVRFLISGTRRRAARAAAAAEARAARAQNA